jgi:hypothetical protein
MNKSAAWFTKHYQGCNAIHIEVHPAYQVQSAANFLVDVMVMRVKELKSFVKAVKNFFQSFQRLNFKDLSLTHIQNLLVENKLDVDNLIYGEFTKKTVDRK